MTSKPPGIYQSYTEDAERRFWAAGDSTRYVDWAAGKRRKLAQLRPSLRTISLRLPVALIDDLKILANQRDVPYQSLLKVFLAERLAQERRLPGLRTPLPYRIVSASEKIGRYSAISTNATKIPMKIMMAGSISDSTAVIFVFTSSS
jgi:predicted DNA binding CopG/RHH family protein